MRHVSNLLGVLLFFGAVSLPAPWEPTPAEAALVTFQFSGDVTDVPASLYTPGGSGATGFDAGLKLKGSYTFESLTPGLGPPPPPNSAIGSGVALYPGLIRMADVSVGNYVARFEPGLFSTSLIQSGSIASYSVDIGVNGNLVNGFAPLVFSINLFDETGTAFDSVDLPGTQPPSIASFSSTQWTLSFLSGATVGGPLSTLSPVPLPPSVLLFGAGLVALTRLYLGIGRIQKPGAGQVDQ